MTAAMALTVGADPDGRLVAIITEGAHPQTSKDGACEVLMITLVADIPNGDTGAWFERMKMIQPWKTRQ